MNDQEQVTRLRGLLERIQRNAARPRGAAPLPPPAAFAPPPPLPAAPPPPVVAAPPVVATPAAAAYAPPAPSTDQSVDELLGLSAPVPVDVDVPLDTLPPVAETAAAPSAPSEAPEAEPIPLVSVSAHEPPPPAIDDAFGLESEVSEVRVATAPRDLGPEVTVAAIEAEAEPIATEELSEDDLVEVTEGTPAPADADVDIDFEDEEEQPPASSQRKVASSMDEALAAAAAQVEAEHEVPIKTPPPESGPQEAPAAGLAAPPAPDVDALLGEELEIPTHAEAGASPALAPTAEQLGQTIDLEEARGPELELAEPPPQSDSFASSGEELEVALPGREVAGGYDDSLMPPPQAREDLEAHRRRLEEDIAPPPESLATLPSVQPGPAPQIVPFEAEPSVEVAAAAPLEASPIAAMVDTTPEIIARPAPMGAAESFTSVREAFRPSTFVELLDASLSLGGS